jgi:outer membrane lipoprotein SlyB
VKTKLSNSRKIKGLIPIVLLSVGSAIPGAWAAPDTVNAANVRKMEQALQGLYTRQLGVPVNLVNCPNNINIRAGSTFECRARAQEINFGIIVKMEDNQGRFDSRTKGLLVVSKIEDLIQRNIKEKTGVNVTANCGSKLRPAVAGETFSCQVRDQKGQSRNAQVTVKDDSGNINVKL